MPNLIYNTLKMQGTKKEIKKVKRAICSESPQGKIIPIDFEKIVPMPMSLHVAKLSDAEMIYSRDYLKRELQEYELERLRGLTPKEALEAIELAKKYHENFQEFGFISWYEWRIQNWGTKWNAMPYDEDFEETENEIRFSTAWSPPIGIVRILASRFPKIDFEIVYFDEATPDEENTIYFKAEEPPRQE